MSGGSFAYSNHHRLHIGLGDSASVDQVEVHWRDKLVKRIKLPAGVDRYYSIEEGNEAASVVP
jgi:hypothetical protein